MDNFSQTKLHKSEWDGIEVPVDAEEKNILQLIIDGFHNENVYKNRLITLLKFIKMDDDVSIYLYLYDTYFKNTVNNLVKKYRLDYTINIDKKIKTKTKLNTKNKIRVENASRMLNDADTVELYEYVVIDLCENLLKHFHKSNGGDGAFSSSSKMNHKWIYYYYTIKTLSSYNIDFKNPFVSQFVDYLLEKYINNLSIEKLVENSVDIIEKNEYNYKYSNITLYSHQKELFQLSKLNRPKLIFLDAPTSTGKTVSPIGLAESHKIIFMCAARHVGLALAREAISSGRKVAFAFGCRDTSDIRLHWNAAKEAIRDRRTGAIRKVDNSVGDRVEIIICDITSYTYAMHYMCAFNPIEDIILYWDEPTISLDYETHELHSIIQENWVNNCIPNVVMSSATLPSEEEVANVIANFKRKFDHTIYRDSDTPVNAFIKYIKSHEFTKSMPIIDTAGYKVMPHFSFDDYSDIKQVAKRCRKNQTLLRYFDLGEAVKFIKYCNERQNVEALNLSSKYLIANYFSETVEESGVHSIDMSKIKNYYVTLLAKIPRDKWREVFHAFQNKKKCHIPSSLLISTADAHTLTSGPTIYIARDVDKIANFLMQRAAIPAEMVDRILNIIQENTEINNRIAKLEKDLEDGLSKDEDKEKKMIDMRISPEMKRLSKTIEGLRKKIKSASLNNLFIPNTVEHLERWQDDEYKTSDSGFNRPFCSDITENTVERIMQLNDIEAIWKIMLLMGIGVFRKFESETYTEIMKELASKQKLYLILASTDYIYGTNYQFCHGYIGKDVDNITSQKLIQAIGRIGRTRLQQNYTIRFRNTEIISKLWLQDDDNIESFNMNKLFTTIK